MSRRKLSKADKMDLAETKRELISSEAEQRMKSGKTDPAQNFAQGSKDDRRTVLDVPMAAPTTNGDRPLPRSTRTKGLLPSTWLDHTLQIEYVVAGELRTTTGVLLDLYPAGTILNVSGYRTLLAWETLATASMVPD